MLWGFPGAAAIAANTARREKNNRTEKSGGTTSGDGPSAVDDNSKQSAEDAAAGLSLRALDLLREIMKRSAGMQVDLSDERVMAAWMQGLSDAAQVVAQESGLGHLQPVRRWVFFFLSIFFIGERRLVLSTLVYVGHYFLFFLCFSSDVEPHLALEDMWPTVAIDRICTA